MAGTTSLGFPYPELTDDPNGAAQIQALAEAVDAKLVAPAWPVGDASNSVYLTGSDISFTANDNKNIVTSGAITLARSQWVTLAGKANFSNQGSATTALIGIYIDVDAVVIPELTSGGSFIGANGTAGERLQLTLPSFSVFLAAGAHTFRLRGDRNSVAATINARATDSLNNTHSPCSLTVIV